MQTSMAIILDAALKSTVLLGLAWVVTLLFRNLSAASRHSLRLCALGACLLLPVFSALLPEWHINVVRRVPGPVSGDVTHSRNFTPRLQNSAGPRLAPRVQVSETPTLSVTARMFSAVPWQLLLLIVWITGASIFMVRMLAGRARLSMLLRRAVSMDDPAWNAQAKSTAENMGIRRAVALLASRDTDVPLSTGAWRPKVILSPDFEEWSLLRRSAILCHELAHIRRLDTVSLAVAQVGLAVYWFHPLVWITVRALREDRERACDDYVLASGARPSEYARELLEIADSLRLPDFTAALAMARRSELEGRVMAILNPKLNRGDISGKTTLMAALITLAIALPMAALRARSAPTLPPQKTETSQPASLSGAPSSPSSQEPAAPAIHQDAVQARSDEDAADQDEKIAAKAAAEARGAEERAEAIAKQMAELTRLASQAKNGAYEEQITELRARMAQLAGQKDLQQAALEDQLATLAKLKSETEANPERMAELRAQLAQLSNISQFADVQAEQKALADRIAALSKLKAVPWVRSGELAELRAQYVNLEAMLEGFNPDHRPVFTNECIVGKSVKYNLQKNFDGQRRNQVVTWAGDSCNATLSIDGMIALDADGGRIESLSEGGTLEVKEQRGQTVRELRITSSASGLKYVLKVNGHENPFDEEAKAWLAEFLRAYDQYSASC